MAGIASRRAAEELIVAGEVKVNGTVVTDLATKVHTINDAVTVNGKRASVAHNLIYILLNKPKDYITTISDEKGRRTVMDLVNVRERVYPVGRLDRNTSGVLLLTNDGDLANKLMRILVYELCGKYHQYHHSYCQNNHNHKYLLRRF